MFVCYNTGKFKNSDSFGYSDQEFSMRAGARSQKTNPAMLRHEYKICADLYSGPKIFRRAFFRWDSLQVLSVDHEIRFLKL